MEQLTALQIIDETIEYYKTNPRSISKTKGCVYLNEENGAMCAVGRCLTDEGLKIAHKNEGMAAHEIFHHGCELKPQYKGVPQRLWGDLQIIHDTLRNWTKTDEGQILSNEGIEKVNQIKKEY